MHKLLMRTQKLKEIVDITDRMQELAEKEKMKNGLCHIFVKHTTCAITTADLDPGTDLDMLDAFETLIPKLEFRHPHDPSHVPDHILSSLIGCSLTVPIQNGELLLGQWQRIILVERSGPRERELTVSFVKL